MKKRIIGLIALSLCASSCFYACNVNNDSPKKAVVENTSNEENAKLEEQFWGLNETAEFKNLKITATDIQESNGSDFLGPQEGNTFIGVKFEIENISDETQSISSMLLFEAYADGIKCDYSFTANTAFDEGTLDGDLSAGKKMVGWYAIEIPEDWQSLELEVKANWLSDNTAKFVFEK